MSLNESTAVIAPHAISSLLKGLISMVLATSAGCLLSLPWLFPELFFLSWFAFIPLLFALDGANLKQAYLRGLTAGVAFWCIGSFWMGEFIVNLKGYSVFQSHAVAVVFWVYAAQSFALAAVVYIWLCRSSVRTRRLWRQGVYQAQVSATQNAGKSFSWYDILLWPLCFVTMFSLYPVIFNVRLAESQSMFLSAIQATDLFGPYALDMVIALSNNLLFLMLRHPFTRLSRSSLACCTLFIAVWFGYGFQQLAHWENQMASWPQKSIGLVQPNDPVSLDIAPPKTGFSLSAPPEMEATERLAEQGADIVLWPESRFKGYLFHRSVARGYNSKIASLNMPLLFHDVERVRTDNGYDYYNSAVVLGADGVQAGAYRKVELVPLGERLPTVFSWPIVRPLLTNFFGEFLREIRSGSSHAVVAIAGMSLVPKICYESSFPEFIADAIGGNGEGKVLAVLSQDGWFGATKQPIQHLHSSILRAVENRVPLIHVINNGPSAVVLPNGRVLFQTQPFVTTEAVVTMPYSSSAGGSFYSRFPNLFPHSLYCLFLLIAFLALVPRGRR